MSQASVNESCDDVRGPGFKTSPVTSRALRGFSFLSGKMGVMGKACFTVLLKGLAEVKLMNGLD